MRGPQERAQGRVTVSELGNQVESGLKWVLSATCGCVCGEGAKDGLLVFQIKTGLGGTALRNRVSVTPWD